MLLLSELLLPAGPASKLAVHSCFIMDQKVTTPSPAVLGCCNCQAWEDLKKGEASILTPSLPTQDKRCLVSTCLQEPMRAMP